VTARRERAVIEPRPLSGKERGVLGSLLGQDFEGAGTLRGQLPHTLVVGGCTCGCVTIDLAVDKDIAEPAVLASGPIRSEAAILNSAGEPLGGVIVLLHEGFLRTLEVFSYGHPISVWPDPDRMKLVLRDI
jgi:hypothetical protein